mgnify:CR=1 FL=1
MAYQIINLKDIYNELGENNTKELLKEFSCPINKDVEYFIKNRAIEFSKQDISRTYIVMSSYKQKNVIAGYFAITNKSTIIKKFILSKTKRKRLLRFANYDEDIKGYHIALPLIGQIGKNFYNNYKPQRSDYQVVLFLFPDKESYHARSYIRPYPDHERPSGGSVEDALLCFA